MDRIHLFTAIGAAFLGAASANNVLAQAVQLPTFQFFTVNTTVSVPDRGGAYLGGVSRAASGRISQGIPLVGKVPGLGRLARNEVLGSSVAASGVSVTATIIDHRELDEAVLAESRARRGETANVAPALRLAPTIPEAKAVASVDEIRRQNEQQDRERRQEALALIEKGRQAEAAGKTSVAVVYYHMAARRADESLRQQIAVHLATMRTADASIR